MGKNTVRVIARTRPTDNFANDTLKFHDDDKTVSVHWPRRKDEKGSSEVINNAIEDHAFKLDHLLKDASQETVFDVAAMDIVKATMAGFNGTIMAYGQTGAGKTYTMMGGSDYRTRGIVPRAIKAIYDEIATHADKTYEVSVSFLEVYQERIYDLIDPTNQEDVAIQEDSKGSITVRGVSNKPCRQEAEALAYLFEGNTNRVTAEHGLNKNSSRSHTIFTLHVTSRSRVESESASLVSKLHCIDLAGSERLSKTGSTEGKLVREAQFINKSLTFLEQVVMALGNTQRGHVPFRQSKLTNLLKDSLGGNSKTTMIANLWPEERNMEESISTFKFAVRMMRVQTEASVNVMLDPATHVKQLQRQISDLKAELQMQNQLVGKSHIVYEGEIGPDERYEMEKVVKNYIQGTVQEVPVRSLREVKEYFSIFKAFVDTKDAEFKANQPDDAAAAAKAAGSPAGANPSQGAKKDDGVGVGTVDPSSGVSFGVAAPAKSLKDISKGPLSPTKPSGPPPNGAVNNSELERATSERGDEVLSNGGDSYVAGRELPDKAPAFDDFKATDGHKLVAALRETQQQLQSKKRRAVELSTKVNEIKMQIDSFAFQLEQKRLDRQARGEDEIVDDEEFEIVRLVKERKADYRVAYDQLSAVKAERDHLVKNCDHAKAKLLSEFELWYESTFGARSKHDGLAKVSSVKALRDTVAGGGGTTTAANVDDDDMLDEGERFEMLELNRVMNEDPDSVAFYSAKKITQTRQSMRPKTNIGKPKRR